MLPYVYSHTLHTCAHGERDWRGLLRITRKRGGDPFVAPNRDTRFFFAL